MTFNPTATLSIIHKNIHCNWLFLYFIALYDSCHDFTGLSSSKKKMFLSSFYLFFIIRFQKGQLICKLQGITTLFPTEERAKNSHKLSEFTLCGSSSRNMYTDTIISQNEEVGRRGEAVWEGERKKGGRDTIVWKQNNNIWRQRQTKTRKYPMSCCYYLFLENWQTKKLQKKEFTIK